MADIIVDLFDESKQYVKTLYQRGRDVPSDEFNEMEDLFRVAKRRTFHELHGDGFFTLGFQIQESVGNPNEIIINDGAGLIQGEFIKNPAAFPYQGLTTPSGSDRTDIVYLRVREIEITSADDPDIEFSDIGETARRVKLEWEVFVDEGSTTLPTTTGDLHAAGIHYELIGYLNREDGNPDITATMILDNRRIIGSTTINEDKNLHVIDGGNVSWEVLGANVLSFDDDIRIVQPSTAGHAVVSAAAYPSGFSISADSEVVYVNLNRSALTDYNVTLQQGLWTLLPNNPNAFVLFVRNASGILYATDGTVWGSNTTHPMRVNPFTGLIVNADVSPTADIEGTKMLDDSIPWSKLKASTIQDTLTAGLYTLSDTATLCPSGYTKIGVGTDDTYLQFAASGSGAAMAPAGANTHNHGSHSHGSGSYGVPLPLFDLFNVAFGGPGNFDAFQSAVGSGIRTQTFSVTGNSASTAISTVNHEPKHIRMVLCKKT